MAPRRRRDARRERPRGPRPLTLRIVAGEQGGRRLVTPEGVRPTTERVREALFSSLGELVVGASVLDLFAGSGAMAFEALSRGAAGAVLVEVDRHAAEICRTNADALGVGSRARVLERAVLDVVGGPPPAEAPFDLVCCDPPYDVPGDEVAEVVRALGAAGWLTPDARVVVERPAGDAGAVTWPPGWSVRWERRYGDTLVTVVTPV